MLKAALDPNRITLTESGRRLEEARGANWIKRVLIALTALAALVLLGFFLLAYADYEIAGNGATSFKARAEWVWVRGDHLHYAVHIAAGRVFDICPCTHRAAAGQYFRAHFHAVTPLQQAVAANSRPQTAAEWRDYLVGPFAVTLEWLHDGVTWLGGDRPSQRTTVLMDQYEFLPAEIEIARGTTVTWRNVDELGEAHTVTADPGQLAKFDSNVVEPDESFSYMFTERGTYVYYSRDAGEPGRVGMSGVVYVH